MFSRRGGTRKIGTGPLSLSITIEASAEVTVGTGIGEPGTCFVRSINRGQERSLRRSGSASLALPFRASQAVPEITRPGLSRRLAPLATRLFPAKRLG